MHSGVARHTTFVADTHSTASVALSERVDNTHPSLFPLFSCTRSLKTPMAHAASGYKTRDVEVTALYLIALHCIPFCVACSETRGWVCMCTFVLYSGGRAVYPPPVSEVLKVRDATVQVSGECLDPCVVHL